MLKITKKGEKAWVTFNVAPREGVKTVVVCGAWNEWQEDEMKPKKDGTFSVTKIIPTGQSYEFGYKVNGDAWEADAECPMVSSPYNSHNSLLEL